MKTVKILIALAILSTSFYACKKEEMNIKSGEVNIEKSSQINSSLETAPLEGNGMFEIIFNKLGTMVIKGNPNLEKLLIMYNASETAIVSANKIFTTTNEEILAITFDKEGNTISSNIPSVPIGSTIETFIYDFCNLLPKEAVKLTISKNKLERNLNEYWNAMPKGTLENFEKNLLQLQDRMPKDYSIQVEIAKNEIPKITVLDGNANPQIFENLGSCGTGLSLSNAFSYSGGWLKCVSDAFNWF